MLHRCYTVASYVTKLVYSSLKYKIAGLKRDDRNAILLIFGRGLCNKSGISSDQLNKKKYYQGKAIHLTFSP